MSAKKRLARHRAAADRTPLKPDPNEIITFRGWKMSRRTAAAVKVYEEKLGFELTIVQGPYHTGVGASAGTHDRDGVIDLAPYRWRKKVRVGRANSWAIWHRPPIPNLWGEHEHGVLKGTRDLAPLAATQLTQYDEHTDGLAGHAHDGFPFHPALEPFNYNAWWHDQLLTTQIKGVSATINKLLERLSAARARRKQLQQRKQHH